MSSEYALPPSMLPREAVLPDYGDGGIVALARSFGAFLDGQAWHFPSLAATGQDEDAPVLVFVLIDGLGDGFLRRHGAGGWLQANRRAGLTSVFPSTTASAVTTLLTGLEPVTHGLTGWHIQDRRFGGVLAPLPMRTRDGSRVGGAWVMPRLFPYGNLFRRRRRPAVAILPREIAGSRFSQRHCRGATVRGHAGLADMIAVIAAETAGLKAVGGGYIHAYYSEFDALSHEFGSESSEALECFRSIDLAIGQLAGLLDGAQARLVLCADHGFLDSPEANQIALDAVPDLAGMLAAPLFGERRATFCQVRDGAGPEFEAAATEALDGVARVVHSDRLLDAGLFGHGPVHARMRERIGTYTLLMEPGWTILDALPGEVPHRMVGVHGGLTAEEMRVPLIVSA